MLVAVPVTPPLGPSGRPSCEPAGLWIEVLKLGNLLHRVCTKGQSRPRMWRCFLSSYHGMRDAMSTMTGGPLKGGETAEALRRPRPSTIRGGSLRCRLIVKTSGMP